MAFDPLEKINEISGSLADAITAAEELQNEAPAGFDRSMVADLLQALETARRHVSKLEDQGD